MSLNSKNSKLFSDREIHSQTNAIRRHERSHPFSEDYAYSEAEDSIKRVANNGSAPNRALPFFGLSRTYFKLVGRSYVWAKSFRVNSKEMALLPPYRAARIETVEATFVDLDGVIRLFPAARDRAIEGRYRLPAGSIAQVAFTSTTIEPALTGAIADHAWRENLVTRLEALFPDRDCVAVVRDWSQFSGIVDADALREVSRLRNLGPLVLLTNATDRIRVDLRELGLDRSFDRVVCSCEIGFAKPSYEIFRYALAQVNLLPSKVLFVDDEETNLRTARGLGFLTHAYRHVAGLRDEVERRLHPFA